MEQAFPYLFLLIFVGMWLFVTTILSSTSGWFGLMKRYPDRDERAVRRFDGQSGTLGFGTNLNGILRLGVCPSGLRVGIWRLFAPFTRDFFVPWEEITVRRFTWLFVPFAELTFGTPSNGRLCVTGWLANRVARAAGEDWPEAGTIARPSVGEAFWSVFREWALGMVVVGVLFAMSSDWALPDGTNLMRLLLGLLAAAISVVAVLRFLARAAAVAWDARR